MPPKLRYSILSSFASSAMALSTKAFSIPMALATSLFFAWLTVPKYFNIGIPSDLHSSPEIEPRLPFELGCRSEGLSRIGKIINMLFGKRYLRQAEEGLPAYPFDPLSHPFIFSGMGGIDLDDLLNRLYDLRPPRRIDLEDREPPAEKTSAAFWHWRPFLRHRWQRHRLQHRQGAWPGRPYSSYRSTCTDLL